MKFTHLTCYLALAGAYTAASFGIDKSLVSSATALLYLALAYDEYRGH